MNNGDVTITISTNDWSVTYTEHEAESPNPFAGCNNDIVIASAIAHALYMIGALTWNSFYIIAKATVIVTELATESVWHEDFDTVAKEAETYCDAKESAFSLSSED